MEVLIIEEQKKEYLTLLNRLKTHDILNSKFFTNYSSFKETFDSIILEKALQFIKNYNYRADFLFDFFKYSLFIFPFFNKYKLITTNNNGLLIQIGNNSIFTIIQATSNINFFIKVIKYEYIRASNITKYYYDCIIFDIINGFIFNHLVSINPDFNFLLHIAEYIDSFLSYSYSDGTNEYLNFNNLINTDDTNTESPYSITSITNQSNYEKFNVLFLCINKAINHINLYKLFTTTHYTSDNIIMIELILEKEFINFFNFLLYFGVNYGFSHNDIHFQNIIFNLDNNKIVLIDLGRSMFAKYTIDQSSDELNMINSFLQYQIEKLNFKFYTKYGKLFGAIDITTYTKLIVPHPDQNPNYILFKDFFKIDFEKHYEKDIYIYPMVIFDLMAVCCYMYYYLQKILQKISHDKYTETFDILEEFKKIFNYTRDNNNYILQFNNNNNDLYILHEKYTEIKEKLNKKDYKINNLLSLILDGIYVIALMYILYRNTYRQLLNFLIGNQFYIAIFHYKTKKQIVELLKNHYNDPTYKNTYNDLNHFMCCIFDGEFKTREGVDYSSSTHSSPSMTGGNPSVKELSEQYINNQINKIYPDEYINININKGGNKKKIIKKLKKYK